MSQLIEVISYGNTAAASLLAVYAIAVARRTGSPGRWGAAAFAALALVLLVAAFDERLDENQFLVKAIIVLLLAFPYLLLRFAASFGTVRARWVRLADVMGAVMVVATLALPEIPGDTDPQPDWLAAYTVGLLVYWTVLSTITILGLWRPGRGQPTLARRRTRLMGIATGALNVLILLAGIGSDDEVLELATQVLLLFSLLAFGLGFAPPRVVRLAWRGPEQEALRRATEQLMEVDTVADVANTLLPHVAAIVGGSGAALLAEDGTTVIGSAGSLPGEAAASGRTEAQVVIPLSPPFGSLVVGTSPLTPFFGHEEISILHSLAALADLSLARCFLREREHENRIALERAMEETERANAAKNDFLSRMSHELRTPLNVVLGFGQLLEMGGIDEDQRRSVAHILSAGRHLLDLVNEVLDLARIESGRMTISPEPVELADLTAESVDLIRPLAADRAVRLTADLDGCHQLVIADRQRLKQVLLNLLSNAVKYNRDDGTVEVSCQEAARGRLRLLVRDTGPGIPLALRDKLFEPFERLGADQTVEGTGLGLALSKQLVGLMGGSIGVDTVEGEGSTFWVELVLADAPVDGVGELLPEDSSRKPPSSVERRVLLIEDNLANLKLIEALVQGRAQIALLPAMTGRLGLELAREHRPDLILLDQHLPDIPGAQVLQRLKAHPDTRELPVIIVSADATPGQRRRMLELGATAYVTKPIDVPAFLELLDQLLGTSPA